MKNMKMKPETFANLPKYLELAFTYGTSRGRDTYGYNLVTLTGVCGNDGKYRECGGGYDQTGAALGQFIQHQFSSVLQELTGNISDFYGLSLSKSGVVSVDGACGFDCMVKILTNLLGYDVSYEYKRDRKGRPQYKTAIILKQKILPNDVKLYTEKQVLNKNVFNINTEYGYISEIYSKDNNILENAKYYIKKNPKAKYIALLGHSNQWYLHKVSVKEVNKLLSS